MEKFTYLSIFSLFFFLKNAKKVGLRDHHAVCVRMSTLYHFWTSGLIFTKFCMNVMALEDTPTV